MLARLAKDYEILFNKVKFILGVINEQLKVNKVKRKVLIKSLVEFGLKPMSEISKILKEKKKMTIVQQDIDPQNEEE